MKRAILTGSGLQLADTCPGSAVLPRFGSTSTKADMGSALHEVNALRGEGHVPDLDSIADRWGLDGKDRGIFFARARSMDLQIPDGAVYEVPLCLRADGTVEPVEGGRGSYLVPDDALVALTVDVLAATPEPLQEGRWCAERSVLWALDLKTGSDAYVAPIRRNWQARVSALLGVRWTGAEFVIPGILYPGEGGGVWDCHTVHGEVAPLRPSELAQIDADVRGLAERVAAQEERVKRGQLPMLVSGAHCQYCPARPGCPRHVSEVRALVMGSQSLAAEPLTREQAVKLAGMLGPARDVLDAARDALKAYVEQNGPIPLPGGKVWGPTVGQDTVFDTQATFDAGVAELAPLVGEEDAIRLMNEAASFSKKSVYEAIRAAHAAAGLKKQMTAAYERITAREGVCRQEPSEKWTAYYPKG